MTLQSLVELVSSYIKEQIITGKYLPDQQIKEEEIASHFNISRPQVREAFSRLEAEGLMVKKPRKGCFITNPTLEDVREIYLLKASLYELSVECAIDAFNDSDIQDLENLLEEMYTCIEGSTFNILHYQKSHAQFHRKIMICSGIKRLISIADNLHNQVFRFSYKALQHKEHVQKSMDYHRRIVQAIREKNREKACQLTKEHVLDALDFQYHLHGLEKTHQSEASSKHMRA
jgi:DNA-binding GntR family transcriptional regulator